MSKERVLAALEAHRGEHISGESLAKELDVSRTAIWKAIELLRGEGYDIEATPRKGYRLVGDFDRLSEGAVRAHLPAPLKDISLSIFPTIDSTNNEAKRRFLEGSLHRWDTILAEEQTKGRGRTGKSFTSPAHTGLYMTTLFREGPLPIQETEELLVTVRAAVAVCRAIESLTGLSPKIKWVNDLYLNDKKICGILSEAELSMESHELLAIYLGIGINVTTRPKDFGEVADVAGSLDVPLFRSELAAAILRELLALEEISREEIMQSYRERSFLIGRRVSFIYQGRSLEGLVTRLDDEAHLHIDVDGDILVLSSGEVSFQNLGIDQ